MTRDQLAHLLRAASDITGDPDMLVIGSQAILASYGEDRLPAAATASIEADVAFLDDPAGRKADAVDGAIGELSLFHEQFGYYAQGVSVTTAVLPDGWAERLVRWSNASTGTSAAVFPDRHDLVVSKLVAMREKDLAFASALLDAGLVDAATLRERTDQLPAGTDPRVRDRLLALLDRW